MSDDESESVNRLWTENHNTGLSDDNDKNHRTYYKTGIKRKVGEPDCASIPFNIPLTAPEDQHMEEIDGKSDESTAGYMKSQSQYLNNPEEGLKHYSDNHDDSE